MTGGQAVLHHFQSGILGCSGRRKQITPDSVRGDHSGPMYYQGSVTGRGCFPILILWRYLFSGPTVIMPEQSG